MDGWMDIYRSIDRYTVHRAPHVAEPVHLDQVAQLRVEDDAPADKLRVQLHARYGEALGAQVLLAVVVGPLLPLFHPVVDQRVIHVVPDHPNVAHVKRARAEDALRRERGRCVRPEFRAPEQLVELLAP